MFGCGCAAKKKKATELKFLAPGVIDPRDSVKVPKKKSGNKVEYLLPGVPNPKTEKISKSLDGEIGFTIIDQYIYDARLAIINGEYDKALLKSQQTLNIEPNNITALEIMGSAFFMLDQPEKARRVWQRVLKYDPENKIVKDFLEQVVEPRIEKNKEKESKTDINGFTITDQYIYDARQAIIDGKYDEALTKCQQVLNLEPQNITALETMGSAFFMMEQPDKAKAVWMKVMEIDPTNKVVPEFLNQMK